ncbi:MAG: serine/threonine protein kinase [Planctomycetes bacterium]|nr:serine/threonine protein kinase [Planctomycetota bacterium]
MPWKSPENAADEPLEAPATLRLLRSLGTDVESLLQQLADRLGAPDAASWVASATSSQVAGSPLEQLVRDALARATLAADGDASALRGADADVLQKVWALVLESVPAAAGDVPAALAAIPTQAGGEPLVPQFLGGYELLDVLGEGAFGTVFRGKHRDKGSFAAVKVLRAASQNSDLITRFRLEAKLAAQLVHPAIVAVRDSGVERHAGLATPYIVYELVDGLPFARALAGKGTDRVLASFASVCEAMVYAHSCGILHRDIKSANVLVDAAGGAHVLDFGVARPEADSDLRVTRSGEILGTPSSMSPEQASGKVLDARSDIYSLGAMLFEALAGEMPHRLQGMSAQQALVVVTSSPARSLANVCPGLSADLVAVVDTALAFAATDRYPTVAALLADVEHLRAGRPVSVSRPNAWQVLRMFARRNKRLAAIGSALALIALVTVTALFVAWRQSVEAVAATRVAERTALDAKARNLRTLRFMVQALGPMVESYPSTGEQYNNLVAVLDRATEEDAAGTQVAETDVESLRIFASLRELAGDLAFRGGRWAASRANREAAVALLERAILHGGPCVVDLARARVKLGDLDQESAPGTAKMLYEQAHAVFVAAAALPEAEVVALDELGWSYERLAGLAWTMGFHAEAFTFVKQRLPFVESMVQRYPDAARRFHLARALAQFWVYAEERPVDSGIDRQQRVALARRASEAAVLAVTQHPNRRSYQELAIKANSYFGRDCLKVGDQGHARAAFERAVGYAETLAGQDPGSGDVQSMAVWAHYDLALCLAAIGDLLAAEQEHLRAAALCERALPFGAAAGLTAERVDHFRTAALRLAAQRREREAKRGN